MCQRMKRFGLDCKGQNLTGGNGLHVHVLGFVLACAKFSTQNWILQCLSLLYLTCKFAMVPRHNCPLARRYSHLHTACPAYLPAGCFSFAACRHGVPSFLFPFWTDTFNAMASLPGLACLQLPPISPLARFPACVLWQSGPEASAASLQK